MKVQHLLEYQFPKIQQVNVAHEKHPKAYRGRHSDSKIPAHMQKNRDTEHLGSGTFSAAFHNPKQSPHDIRKVSRQMDRFDIDGFYYYMHGLADNPDNTNPYYPRFREIKVYTDEHDAKKAMDVFTDDRKDKITYSTKMEKLYPLRDMSRSEEDAMLARMLGTGYTKMVTGAEGVNQRLANILNSQEKADYGRVLYIIKFLLHEPDAIADDIQDADLMRATNWLREFQRTASLGFDLHGENIMYRKTPYGPQLVITDPFSYHH